MDIHKQSTGDTERKEDLEAVIQKLNHEILNLVGDYNGLVADYNNYSEMTQKYNWDMSSWPSSAYPEMVFYDASTINGTLKSGDVAKMKALKRSLWLKVHHLKDVVSNAKVAFEEAKKSFEMREQLWEVDQKRRDEEKEQERIKEKNRKSVTFVVVFILILAFSLFLGISSGIQCAQNGEGWGWGVALGLFTFFSLFGVVGNELHL